MLIINHRINKINDLKKIHVNDGIEVDVRYHKNNLILHHDPFNHHIKKKTNLKDLLDKCSFDGPLILNIKSEGIEEECIKMMNQYKIKNWFFLDMSMPFFVKYGDIAYKNKSINFSPDNLAVRFSDREPIDYALSFKGKARWVWVDYFTNFPLTKEAFFLLKKASFKVCLVSPELHKEPILSTSKLVELTKEFDIDAICTKDRNIWI